jgi:hypothetical protein
MAGNADLLGATMPHNKELKLTKPGQNGASQLNSSVLRTVGERPGLADNRDKV